MIVDTLSELLNTPTEPDLSPLGLGDDLPPTGLAGGTGDSLANSVSESEFAG